MSKLTRENLELTWGNPGVLRAEDIPYDASNSIKDIIGVVGVPYKATFTDTEFQSGNGVLTVTHNKGLEHVIVLVVDNNGVMIEPDTVTYVNTNQVAVDLTPEGPAITGTWSIIIR